MIRLRQKQKETYLRFRFFLKADEYESGVTGVLVASTGEAPGTNRLEIAGSRGQLILENNELTFKRTRVDEREFNKKFKGPGLEGINEMEISNAIHMSAWKNKTVTLPVDPEEHYKLLMERVK